MDGIAIEKVPEGKLLRIRTTYNKKITKVQITGDFFAHPEDSIERIEERLSGLSINFDDKSAVHNLSEFIKDSNFELIGINPEAIIRVLKKAIR